MIRRSSLRVCVIVPARNEEASIGETIASLARQVGVDFTTFAVRVLANNCSDETATHARQAQRRFPHLNLIVDERTFPEHEANIGTVRRYLMDEAADCLPSHGVIASTDGDTTVDPDWLARILQAIDQGADLVGGRILTPMTSADPALRKVYLADTMYRFLMSEAEALIDPDPSDPWPRHFQHFSANLAVTRAAYLRVGGLPPVPCLEDMALYDRLREEDAAIRHSSAVRATTSPRLTGRVAVGLSTQLAEWRQQLDEARPPMMESADFVIARARERRRLREEWAQTRWLRNNEPFGRYCACAMTDFQPSVPFVEPLDAAIAHFRQRLPELRRSGPPPLCLSPLEQIEPVRLFARPVEMAEWSV